MVDIGLFFSLFLALPGIQTSERTSKSSIIRPMIRIQSRCLNWVQPIFMSCEWLNLVETKFNSLYRGVCHGYHMHDAPNTQNTVIIFTMYS